MQGTLVLCRQAAAALIHRTAAWWGQVHLARPVLPAATPLRLSWPGAMPQMSSATSDLAWKSSQCCATFHSWRMAKLVPASKDKQLSWLLQTHHHTTPTAQ